MKKTVPIRFGPRDTQTIAELGRSAMTPSQIAYVCGYTQPKKASQRCTRIRRAGLIKCMPNFQPARQGKGEFVYYRGRRPKPSALPHILAVVDFRVAIHQWLHQTLDVNGEFFYGHELGLTNPIPDAAIILQKNQKSALVFVEVDMGTETVFSPRGHHCLSDKLLRYGSYFDSGQYNRDFHPNCFRGFRLALIVPPTRIRRVQRLASTEHHDFLLVSTLEAVKSSGIHQPIWYAFDGTIVDLFGRRKDGD